MKTLLKLTGENIFLPFYHTVSNVNPPHIRHLYQVRNQTMFREDMEFLLRNFQPVDAGELYRLILNPGSTDKPFFHLSFDDGLREVKEIALPVLLELGIPATLFINSGFVDNRALFYRYKASLLIDQWQNGVKPLQQNEVFKILELPGNASFETTVLSINYDDNALLDQLAMILEVDFQSYLSFSKPYLQLDELRDIAAKGFTIGGHSIDHPEYKRLDISEQFRQTKVSTDFAFEQFHQNLRLFSFPFSDEGVSRDFFHKINTPDQPVADLTFGISGLKKDIISTHLHRFPMEGNLMDAETLIKAEYLNFKFKKIIGKSKIKRD